VEALRIRAGQELVLRMGRSITAMKSNPVSSAARPTVAKSAPSREGPPELARIRNLELYLHGANLRV
jgi:hypothetical protein